MTRKAEKNRMPSTMIRMKATMICLLGLAISTQAVAQAQAPTLGAQDPSDPHQDVPAVRYQSVTSGARSFRPTDPLPWRGVNDRVAPKPKPETDKK
jgi:hypothetical protein